MGPPLIAIIVPRLGPGRISRWSTGAYAAPDLYVQSVRRAGGAPVLVPPFPEILEPALGAVQGILLMGGGDVDPARYGIDSPHPAVQGVDAQRDGFEIDLLRRADERRLPTLAICRGAQVMNVAFGGTLLQHLPEREGTGAHQVDGGPGERMHDVMVAPASRLAAATGHRTLAAASRHHQGIDRLGPGLTPVAWADDTLVEAVERADGWMLGVQWHPETTARTDPAQQALFDALVRRAGATGGDPP